MITLVPPILGALFGGDVRAASSNGRRPASRLFRLGRPLRSGGDIVVPLIDQVLGDPFQPLPRCQGEVDQIVAVFREHLPALALAAGGPRRLALLASAAPTDYMGSRVHLILLAETAQHLIAQCAVDHPTSGARAAARQYTPVNAVRQRPPSGSESYPEGTRCHPVTAASGRPERGAGP